MTDATEDSAVVRDGLDLALHQKVALAIFAVVLFFWACLPDRIRPELRATLEEA